MTAMSLVFDVLAKDNASATLDKVGDSAERTGKKGHGLGIAMGAGLAVAAGAIAEFGKKSIDAAVEGEAAHAALAQAIKNTGGSIEELEPRINKLSTGFAKFGFTNDEVEKGLASMTTSLRDPQKAMDAMGLAADLARYKHISLADASVVVAKAMEGQLRPLKQLGIDLPVAAGGALKLENAHNAVAKAQEKVNDVLAKYPDALNATSKAHDKYLNAVRGVTTAQDKLAAVQDAAGAITKGLADAVGGQASAAADTYAGKVAAMHARMENLTEQIGTKLLPVFASLIDHFQSAINFVQRNSAVMGPLIAAVAGLAAVVIAVNTAMKAWNAVTAAGAAIRGLFITETVAQTAATEGATAATVGLDAAMSANPIGLVVLAIAALVAGFVLAYKHSETFRNIVGALWDIIKKSPLGELLTHLGLVRDAFGWIVDKVEAVIRALGRIAIPKALKDAVGLIGKVGGAAGGVLGNLNPFRASGGPVTAGHPYIVGEFEPELFVPNQSGQILNQSQIRAAGGGSAAVDTSRIEELLERVEARLASMPRDYQLGMRAGYV